MKYFDQTFVQIIQFKTQQFLFQKIIKMEKIIRIILLLAILHIAYSLSFFKTSSQHAQADKQLAALKDQQSAFEKQVLTLIEDIKNVELKVNASTDTSAKVMVLEKAIVSQRQKIFQLQNLIIPPFNLSKTACRELTNDQKVKIVQQLQKAKNQVVKLKDIATRMPNNAEVVSINSDISKQEILLDSLQKAIYTKCETSVVLTPTVFQSNLFATNWILGKQSIENVVQQYYQRSRLYHNVTNCPVEFPFFDGSKCIKCEQPLPIFNMQARRCQKCPYDTKLNTDKHLCQQIIHYTDYNSIENYFLDGANISATPTGSNTPCPSTRPFFNGTCVKCALPSYWNVKQNKCKDCPVGQVFNVNAKTCTIPTANSLTYLQGNSRWVTSVGNLTAVLKQRADLLASKPNQYNLCDKDYPSFDGIICLSCPNQFSLAEKRCVSAPTGYVYNPNLHAYVAAQTGKETNNNALSIISPTPLPVAKNPCDIKTPYYDGIACIQCPQPFPLFDVTSKKCVRCSSFEFYDRTKLQCVRRPIVYISTNFNNLVGTPKTNFAAYKAELLDKVKNNGESILRQCNVDEYSNYTACFKCNSTQKFNVETKKCDVCNGTIDPNTLICQPLKTLLTDLNAKNLIVGNNSNINTYIEAQKKVTGPTVKCPIDRPYAVGGLQCIACTDPNAPYFDLESQKCIKCPELLYYNIESRKCEKEIFITNLTALKRVIEVENYTIANVKVELQNLSKTRKTILCPELTPVASILGDKCSACDNQLGFFNLKTKQCVLGVYISNTVALKASGRVVETENNTLQALQLRNNAIVLPKVPCPPQRPLFNGQVCISCAIQQFYSIQKRICLNVAVVSNTDAIGLQNNYLQKDNNTLANLIIANQKVPQPKRFCPPQLPLFSENKCISCKQSIYNIITMKCDNCVPGYIFDKNTHICIKTPDYHPNLNNNLWIVSSNSGLDKLSLLIKQRSAIAGSAPCPNEKPHFSNITKLCEVCPLNTFWNYETYTCMSCGVGEQVDPNTRKCGKRTVGLYQTNLNSKNILLDGFPRAQFEEEYNNNKAKYPQIQDCPADKPYFDGFECIQCRPANPLFSMLTKLCSSCPPNSIYDETNKYCHSGKDLKTVSPSIGKMYSSIF